MRAKAMTYYKLIPDVRLIRMMLMVWFIVSTLTGIRADVHVVIFATYGGRTGHCGLAIDDYCIRAIDQQCNGVSYITYDTIATGTVTYYDLWPVKDEYKGNYDGDIAARYYRLPSSQYKQWISLKTLSDQGVPHKFNYPADGIVTLVSSPKQDFLLRTWIDDQIRLERDFNAIHHNCCDFVGEAIYQLTGQSIDAREWIIRYHATTPNPFYKAVAQIPNARITKNPGDLVDGTFVEERVYKRFLPIIKILPLIIQIPCRL
jgi:hypothetical protein